MRNGTQSNKLRLIDNNGESLAGTYGIDDMAVQYDSMSEGAASSALDPITEMLSNKWVFIAVSTVCAAGAIAAGSYSVYLSRRRVAETALDNVQDLLKTCQRRMRDLENDLNSSTSVQSV